MNRNLTEQLADIKAHLKAVYEQLKVTRALEEMAVEKETEVGMVYTGCIHDSINKPCDETTAAADRARECYKEAVAKTGKLADAVKIYSKEIAYFERMETILTRLVEIAAKKDQLEMLLQLARTAAQLAHDQHTAMLLQMESHDHIPDDLTRAHEATVAADDALGQLIQESAEVSEAYETTMAEWDVLRVD